MRMPRRSQWLQTSAILALGAAYCVLMVVHAGNARSESFFSPLAYMALVLSALWWGRKGVLMAGILAAVPLAARIWLVATPDPWGDSARLVSFFVVALGLGAVRDQALAAHRACRASERRYRDIVEKSLSGIVIYSDEGILYANPRIQEFMGYRFDEVAGRPFWDFIHKDDQPKVRELVASRKNAAASDLRYDCRLVAKDGRTVWGDIASSLVEYEGKRAVLASVYDISEMERIEAKHQELSRLARKQEEQLVHSTRLAEMGEMAAGIAHELNQPLTGIKNYAQNASYMLRENVGDVAENLRLIAGQVDRASRIIAQMRELARRSERQFALVDINQKLVETVEFVMPQLRLSGVSVSHSLAEDLPPVSGDAIRLEQVFLNLLTNARQAMEDMEVRRLEIRTRHEPENDRPVVIEIVDTGKGFAPETTERLFAPFYSTKKSRHGTGLGLSISLSIVKDHNGSIEAHSDDGRGATFTVRLPAAETAEAGASAQEASDES